MIKNRNIRFVLIGVLIVLFMIISRILGLYVDWLFFTETGYRSVFTKILSVEVLAGACFGVFAFLFMYINTIFINRMKFPSVAVPLDGLTTFSINMEKIEQMSKLFGVLISLFVGILGALWGSGMWSHILVFLNGASTGVSDPVFGKDIGFYLFKLPLYEALSAFVGFIIFISLVVSVAAYAFKGGFVLNRSKLFVAKEIRLHLAILAGIMLFKTAFGFYLDRFELLYSVHGVITGAGYTDINAKLWALNTLMYFSVIAGVMFIAGFAKGTLKVAFYPIGAIVAVYFLGIVVYPGLLQNFKVAPNELAMEGPYIERHIALTKYGFAIDNVEKKPFNVAFDLTARDIQQNDTTVKNIRLWDEAPLLKTLSQLQQIRTYYRFTGIDNDRYVVDGKYSQVMLSTRELSYDDLPSRSWINERLVFTHGHGVAVAHVAKITQEGLPEFIVKDIPPVSQTGDLKITTPEIYFGELTGGYAITNTRIPEFNYPTADGNVYSSYKGNGGVPIDSLAKRLIFASHFKDGKILLSSDIHRESRIIYYRNIVDRVKEIVPFLQLDQDPYIVVSDDGKLHWIIDAYTVSTRLPYSKRLRNRVNYMRNSVKVTVDAYDGRVNFYISDQKDPVIQTYSSIFPGLFKEMAEMPEDMIKHVRYPKDFFKIQTSMYATYHMTDPKTFYNKEDLWEIPSQNEKTMDPYYLIMKLPEEKKEEYALLSPYTPARRDNLAAWFAARCDVPNYGELIVYTFPRDRLVYGPRQIDARIDQDSYISQQLTLWGQRGSQVIRGSLLIIPIENSLVYVQPLYLAAEDKGGLPELRRIIVAYENNVVMEESLDLAFQRIFGGRRAAPTAEALASPARAAATTISDLAREANRLYERMIQFQRQGDWTGYGESLKQLERVLKEMTTR